MLYFVAALLGGLWLSPGAEPGGAVRVRLIRGPIHYDFLLPADPMTQAALGFAARDVPLDHPQARWILVGAGARDFYTTTGTWRDLSAGAVWRGAVGDASVLRVDVAGELRGGVEAEFLQLELDQYRALLDTIGRDVSGPALDVAGLTDTDAYYPIRGRSHLFSTCNGWIGRKLRAAGLSFGRWTPLALSVEASLWRLDRGAGGD